jgi:anti-anti-sigma factor
LLSRRRGSRGQAVRPAGDQPVPAAIDIEHLANGIAVVVLRGEHDLNCKPGLAAALGPALRRGNVLVDLAGCTFLDSTVICTLLRATQQAQVVGVLGLVVPPEARIVYRIASLMRISTFVPIYPSRGIGIASILDED